eukprot:TRINITY_DN9921_c0_g1_i1.p1 TRINITY_DN9921_c0_g1~~TRINITY_DN9921_c0_g1_i1.p1  ORF type:complete len:107 (-),score=14.01 TRINITY_DN9921_c0_g1_i1:212-532(-)
MLVIMCMQNMLQKLMELIIRTNKANESMPDEIYNKATLIIKQYFNCEQDQQTSEIFHYQHISVGNVKFQSKSNEELRFEDQFNQLPSSENNMTTTTADKQKNNNIV